jgi:hypothetical protein
LVRLSGSKNSGILGIDFINECAIGKKRTQESEAEG